MKSLDVLLVVLLSIGAIQGLIYGIILWRDKHYNTIANRFLASILFFFSYRLFVEILKLFGFVDYNILYHILLEYNWIYGALIFFFVKAYVTPNVKLQLKRDWIHFIPVIIEFLWSNFIKSQNFFWDGTRESLSWLGYWGYVVWMHYPTMYIICGILIIIYTLKSEKLLVPNTNPSIEIIQENVLWIKRFLKVLRYYAFLFILIVLIDFFFFDYAFNRFYNYPLFIGLALITYWLGLEGFNRRTKSAVKTKVILTNKEQEQLETIAKDLELLMVEKALYKNPELTLAELSKQLGVKSYLTTKCLNTVFEKKFSDYINTYRIEAIKTLLKDEKNANYTLLSLAFEAGFNSKASFNRAVKKITGHAPSYLKSNS